MTYPVHQIAILSDYSDFVPPSTTDTVKKSIPGEYFLWKNDDIIKLIQDNFASDVIEAYHTIKPNAIKADLARYCILYVYGGWYADLLVTIDGTLEYDLEDFEMFVFRDISLPDMSVLPIANSLFWVKEKNSKILKRAIDLAVSNALQKRYPKNSHRVSGPPIFGTAIAEECIQNDDVKILVGDLSFHNKDKVAEFTVHSWHHRMAIHFGWHRLPGTEDELPNNYQKGSSYNEMFNNREMYV